MAWGIILALVTGCQRRFITLSPIWKNLTRRVYTIYIIHPPVLVGVALALRAVDAPTLLKFAVHRLASLPDLLRRRGAPAPDQEAGPGALNRA